MRFGDSSGTVLCRRKNAQFKPCLLDALKLAKQAKSSRLALWAHWRWCGSVFVQSWLLVLQMGEGYDFSAQVAAGYEALLHNSASQRGYLPRLLCGVMRAATIRVRYWRGRSKRWMTTMQAHVLYDACGFFSDQA